MRIRTTIILVINSLAVVLLYLSLSASIDRKHVETEFKDTHQLYMKYLLHPVKGESNFIRNKQYSQANQDQIVFELLKNKTGGIFIEMGANNGKALSNTLWLESVHDWTGLLIEANPKLCKAIDALHRNVWRLCSCISNTVNAAEFATQGLLGGVLDNMSTEHKHLMRKNTTMVKVPCFILRDILKYTGLTHVNYFSLDVEGAELSILESMKDDLINGSIIVDIWTIEYREWDGHHISVNSSIKKVNKIREYFQNIGGYFEHSHISNDGDKRPGHALDVIFVSVNAWCHLHSKFPNGKSCS